MSLKVTKSKWLVSAFVAASAVAVVGCGDDPTEDPGTSAKPDGGTGGTGGGGSDAGPVGNGITKRCGTLVPITAADTSAPIKTPHTITVLDNATGMPIAPPLSTMTSATDGTWCIDKLPTDKTLAFYTKGEGTETMGTYDTVLVNVKPNTPEDPLSRISSASTASIAGQTGGFTARADAAGLSGGIYVTRGGKRVGAVGCAKVYIDDEPHPAEKYDQRYVNDQSLPTTIAMQSQTLPGRGTFFIGNLSKGMHKFKISVDNGKTFFGETEFVVGRVRQEAASPYKSVLYQIGIDVEGDKTPADCK